MAIGKIRESDIVWHEGQPTAPDKSALEMQKFFDAPVRKLLAKINEIIGESGEGEPLSLGEFAERLAYWSNDLMNHVGDFEDFKVMEFEELKKCVGEQDEAMQAAQEEHHAMQNDLEKQKEDNENAKKYVDSLRELELENMRGVYVGEGEMPANCDVQIDPNGEPDNEIGHVVFESFDLSYDDLQKIITECCEKGKPLVFRYVDDYDVANLVVCSQVYYNNTPAVVAPTLVFVFETFHNGSKSLRVNRHGYEIFDDQRINHVTKIYSIKAEV